MVQWYGKWGQCLVRNCNCLRACLEKQVLMFMLKVLGEQRFGQIGGKTNVFLKEVQLSEWFPALIFLFIKDERPLGLQNSPWGLWFRHNKDSWQQYYRSSNSDFKLYASYFDMLSNMIFLTSHLIRFFGNTYIFLPFFCLVTMLFSLSIKKILTIMLIISVTCGSVDGLKQFSECIFGAQTKHQWKQN